MAYSHSCVGRLTKRMLPHLPVPALEPPSVPHDPQQRVPELLEQIRNYKLGSAQFCQELVAIASGLSAGMNDALMAEPVRFMALKLSTDQRFNLLQTIVTRDKFGIIHNEALNYLKCLARVSLYCSDDFIKANITAETLTNILPVRFEVHMDQQARSFMLTAGRNSQAQATKYKALASLVDKAEDQAAISALLVRIANGMTPAEKLAHFVAPFVKYDEHVSYSYGTLPNLCILAEFLTPEINDHLMKGPVNFVVDALNKWHEQGLYYPTFEGMLLEILSRIAARCSDDFIRENIPRELIINVYAQEVKTRDGTIGKLFHLIKKDQNKSLLLLLIRIAKSLDPEDTRNRIIEPLTEYVRTSIDRLYSVAPVLTELARNLDPQVNDSIMLAPIKLLTELLKIDVKDMAELSSATLKALIDNTSALKQQIQVIKKGGFDVNNETHLILNYFMLTEAIQASPVRRILSYQDYLEMIDRAKRGETSSVDHLLLDETIQLQLRGVVYEAGLVRNKILEIQNRAQELKREVVVVENLSYGAVALAPITEERSGTKYITSTDIRVISTKVGSTESHEDEMVLNPSLFAKADMKYFIDKRPVVIVVDGTTSVADPSRTVAHIPDAFKGYRNYFMTLNTALTGAVDPEDYYVDDQHIDQLRNTSYFQELVIGFSSLGGIKERTDPYKMFFWYPGNRPLDVRVTKKAAGAVEKIRDAKFISGPALVIMQSAIEPAAVDEAGRAYIGGNHSPAFFDDKEHFKEFYFEYRDNYGVVMTHKMIEEARKMSRNFLARTNEAG